MANQWGGGPANYYGTNPYFSGPLRDTGVQMKYSEPTERANNALATGASFLPFVGGMQDASSAYDSYSKGDLLGGLGYTGLAGIGALPFGGVLKKAGGTMLDLLKRSDISAAPLAVRPPVVRSYPTVSPGPKRQRQDAPYDYGTRYERGNELGNVSYVDQNKTRNEAFYQGYLEDFINNGDPFID